MKVLVTGGAGFIGSHTVDLLIEKGFKVRILDNLEPQVHGRKKPDYLNPEAEFILGDVTNIDVWKKVLKNIDAVIHLAAMVGVGQSMYQPVRYLNANTIGTANMYEVLINNPEIRKKIKKIIVASSMSCYGEGKYICSECGIVFPTLRSEEQLKEKKWEVRCPYCDREVKPLPTNEKSPLNPTSIYAISKKDQEEISLIMGRAYNIPTIALRYFNVYGPRQALSNPYTGCCAIFSSLIMNNESPIIFEDGNQTRDFIHVKDVARANLLALKKNVNDFEVFNVGTGRVITINYLAETLISLFDAELKPRVTGMFRVGDIRHAFADIKKIKYRLGFKPKIKIEKGLKDLIEWVKKQPREKDKFEKALAEIKNKALIR